jgi:hypothetical protein
MHSSMMTAIPLYAGFDPREEVGYHAFSSSVIHRSSVPVSIIPLHAKLFESFYAAGQRDGTNAFTYTRFLIPFLQHWRGWAIFADGCDMICMADIAELWALRDEYKALHVVKHDYRTKHARKYRGTAMEAPNGDYERKNWSSLMLINCAHFHWRTMTPERVCAMSGAELHQFAWLKDSVIGDLPAEWNWLCQEHGPNHDAKIVHYSIGIPAFPEYRDTEQAPDWRDAAERVVHATC